MDTSTRTLIVGAVVGAALVVLAIIAPEIYSGTFSDAATLGRVVLVIVLLAAFAFAVKRWVTNDVTANAIIAVPIVVVVGLYVWPYVRPATEVDEAFPPIAASAEGTPGSSAPASASESTTPDSAVADSSPPATAPATTPASAPPTEPESTSTSTSTSTTTPNSTTSTTTTSTTTTTVPTGPVELRRSGFQGLEGHRGSGDAAVYRLEDGSTLLRFEEVDIGSGPVLAVYLVPGADRRGVGGDAVYVAPLTAERGNQNYTVPEGVDLTTGTWTVLVWCETFVVEVANATLV